MAAFMYLYKYFIYISLIEIIAKFSREITIPGLKFCVCNGPAHILIYPDWLF